MKRLLLILVIGLTFAGSLAFAMRGQAQPSHPLLATSPKTIAEQAIAMLRRTDQVASGTPRILLARRVSADELPALGFGVSSTFRDSGPLVLVILHGDFDLLLRGSVTDNRMSYVAYISTICSTGPRMTSAAKTVDPFESAIRDAVIDETPLPDHMACPTPSYLLPAGDAGTPPDHAHVPYPEPLDALPLPTSTPGSYPPPETVPPQATPTIWPYPEPE